MKVRLGDYIQEYSVRNRNCEDIPVYSVTNTQGFCRDYFDKEVASKDKSTYKIVPKGCFAYNPSRINVGSVDWQRNEEKVIVSPLYNVFAVSEKLERQYLYYYLKSDITLQYIKTVATGSVRDNLKLSMLYEYKINLPDINMQKAIANKLDMIQNIMCQKKHKLVLLNDLIKARFIEMFGNISRDCYLKIADVCSIITDGTHQPPKFVQEGIPFIFVSNLANDEITYRTEKFITQENYDELIKRTPIEIGDVLLTTVGSYGHSAVVKTDKPFLFQRHIAYLKPKRELINSDYLRGALLAADAQQQIEEKVKGIAQKTLNLSEIKKIIIPLPPLQKQDEFAFFVAQVDKSKAAVQKSLDEMQLLFNSLMQEYFG
ncbi:restriction endonuclease subunit S [Enterocloster asparagiformis]|uniref:Restriction endonuclease subunit S n=1 Tax=Enterocloster asparagiformis TaxID=333367 RepID=A0A413FGD9_9FIRM|nr:restriction endonuclease subunit S [Enterocloster asparagiformis]RGX29862.1 restriction endonuclease subunit S [Enterocloster asparagiformis]